MSNSGYARIFSFKGGNKPLLQVMKAVKCLYPPLGQDLPRLMRVDCIRIDHRNGSTGKIQYPFQIRTHFLPDQISRMFNVPSPSA